MFWLQEALTGGGGQREEGGRHEERENGELPASADNTS